MYRGVATFTLDYGKCPRWLFERMVKLGREMIRAIVIEEGPDAFIQRIADPAWFQSLGTVLAFDWNASGLTTILTAALKEAIRYEEKDLGIFICGGKGKTSRKTPDEILNWSNRLGLAESDSQYLVYNSKMAAKVDSALIQDGFQIYHHSFFFTPNGAWTVVQQGMNVGNQTARRYHWHSNQPRINADLHPRGSAQIENQRKSAKNFSFVCEPHTGIASQTKIEKPLNLTAQKSEQTRQMSTELVAQSFQTLMKDIQLLRKYSTDVSTAARFNTGDGQLSLLHLENKEFKSHPVINEDFSKSKYLEKILWKLCDEKPESYEKLLSKEGVGPKTMRALSLVSEVIYGAQPSYEDPARYSFAHGGKDDTPYPIDRDTYDRTIGVMKHYIQKARLPLIEKQKMLKKVGF